jgi:hypothetical protein
MKRAFDRITAIDSAFICVNDDLDDVPEEHPSLCLWREFMEKRYPVPSGFEKKTARRSRAVRESGKGKTEVVASSLAD